MIGFKDMCVLLLMCCCSIGYSKSSTVTVIDCSSSCTDNSVPDSLTVGTATPIIDSSTVPVDTSVPDSLSVGTATPDIDSSTLPVETSAANSLSVGTVTPIIDSSTLPVETSAADSLSIDTATPVIDSSTVSVETSVADSLSIGTATPVIDSSTTMLETSVIDSITASSVVDSSYSPTSSSITDSSTTITEPETTQPPPTTPSSQDISTSKPNLDTALFEIDIKVEVNKEFNPGLMNNTSPEYEKWSRELITKLTPVYTNIPGFLYLVITGFTNGSVIGEYQINIRASVPADDVQDAFSGTFQTEMDNLTIFSTQAEPFTDTNNISQIQQTIGDKCLATGICPIGFTCSGGQSEQVTCLSPCRDETCQHGQCLIDPSGDIVCKCDTSEDFVYSGDKCDVKTEKLSMEIGAIAGIAGGLGGGIILFLVIALVLTCCSKRKNKRPKSEDEIHLTELDGDLWGKDMGEVNPAADTKGVYGYRGVHGEDQTYQSWLMAQDKPDHSSFGKSRADDFRPNSNGGYPDNRNHGNERQDWEQMEPAALFSQARSSGLGTGHYHQEVEPDYDNDDEYHFVDEGKSKDRWDVERDRPMTNLPPDQSKSRALKGDYRPEGQNAGSQPTKTKPRPVKDDYNREGHRRGGQPMKSQQRPLKYDYGQEDHADHQPIPPQPRLMKAGYRQGQSVYKNIETDEKYAIRRPALH